MKLERGEERNSRDVIGCDASRLLLQSGSARDTVMLLWSLSFFAEACTVCDTHQAPMREKVVMKITKKNDEEILRNYSSREDCQLVEE